MDVEELENCAMGNALMGLRRRVKNGNWVKHVTHSHTCNSSPLSQELTLFGYRGKRSCDHIKEKRYPFSYQTSFILSLKIVKLLKLKLIF